VGTAIQDAIGHVGLEGLLGAQVVHVGLPGDRPVVQVVVDVDLEGESSVT
jgi:hypothetical protein